jgi:hypothetical protein
LLAPLLAAFSLVTAPLAPSATTLAGSAAATDAGAWYGGPAVVADLASSGALVLAFGLEAKGLTWTGGATLAVALGGLGFGAPVNHVANGHLGRAWGSLSLRLGGVVAGVLVAGITGAATHCQVFGGEENPNGSCSGAALGVAFAIPMLAAIALDDGLLARGPALDRAPTPRTRAGRELLGNSLISGGVILALGSGILLIAEAQQVTDTNRSLAAGPNPSAQYNLDKAYLGVGIGIGLLAVGVAAIAGGAYLVTTAPRQPLVAHLGPWTDGLGARGLAFAARF